MAILCKTIPKKAKEDIRKHNIMITLLDKQDKEIQGQYKIMERIE